MKYFTRTHAQSASLEQRTNSSLEHSHNVLQQNTRAKHFTITLAQSTSLQHSHELPTDHSIFKVEGSKVNLFVLIN
jgi:hypothetical protein